eukprot:m.104088 g.104088  ORF g.104088 m.104088 type:complete len:268 (-) comp13832_c1_seq2:38-841(-)
MSKSTTSNTKYSHTATNGRVEVTNSTELFSTSNTMVSSSATPGNIVDRTTTATSDIKNDENSSSSNLSAIIGVIVACLLLLCVIGVMTLYFIRAKKTEKVVQNVVGSVNLTINQAYQGHALSGAGNGMLKAKANKEEKIDYFNGFEEGPESEYLNPEEAEYLSPVTQADEDNYVAPVVIPRGNKKEAEYEAPIVGQTEVYYGFQDNEEIYASETRQVYKGDSFKPERPKSNKPKSKKKKPSTRASVHSITSVLGDVDPVYGFGGDDC